MFKKEAEKYLQEKLEERKDKFVFELPKVYIEDVKQSFQDGATFGYNRGKEELEEEIIRLKDLLVELYDCIPASMADSCRETLQKVALVFKED